MKLKLDSFLHLLTQHFSIAFVSSFQCEFFQIIRFQLNTVKLIIAAQFFYFGLSSILAHHHIAVFILRKFIEQILFRVLFPILFLCSKVLRNGKSRHNRSMVDTVKLHLVTNIYRIRQRFGYIGKDFIHFRTRLHPFLLGVKHTVGVIQIFSRTQANQTVVCFGILLVYKVNVIGAHQLHIIFFGILYQFLISNLLQFIRFVIGTGYGGLMTLQLQIKVIAKNAFIPLDSLFSLFILSGNDILRHFTGNTSRTDNQSLVIFLQFHTVGTRTHIKSFRPCLRYQLDKIMIAFFILGKHHQVITALIRFPLLIK